MGQLTYFPAIRPLAYSVPRATVRTLKPKKSKKSLKT